MIPTRARDGFPNHVRPRLSLYGHARRIHQRKKDQASLLFNKKGRSHLSGRTDGGLRRRWRGQRIQSKGGESAGPARPIIIRNRRQGQKPGGGPALRARNRIDHPPDGLRKTHPDAITETRSVRTTTQGHDQGQTRAERGRPEPTGEPDDSHCQTQPGQIDPGSEVVHAVFRSFEKGKRGISLVTRTEPSRYGSISNQLSRP